MSGLTQKQLSILTFIEKYVEEKGYSPSYREIMSHFSLSSPGTVYKYIQILKRKKALEAEKGCGRSLKLKTTPATQKTTFTTDLEIPFIGHIEAGNPIEILPQSQSIPIPAFLVTHPEHTYALRIQGDSLNEEYFVDGDIILVEARTEAQSGETILATINETNTVILRYYPDGKQVRLEGKNSDYHSVIVRHEDIQIHGVLVGLIRAY